MVLEINNLSYTYEGKTVLKDINIYIDNGEKVGLVGLNGSGKTTLMQIAAGLKQAEKTSSLTILGKKIVTLEDFKDIRYKIGYLFQNSQDQFIFPNVIDDIGFELRCDGVSAEDSNKQALNFMRNLGIENLKNEIIYKLSGGQKRLVAIAGALIKQKEILFLDEPSNELDNNAQKKVADILKARKSSMLIASHDKAFIDSVCDRVIQI